MNTDTTSDPTPQIRQFFADFESASRDQDWSRYEEMYLPEFLNLDPSSASTVARDDLIAFLPHRKRVFERARATGTTLTSLTIERLDARHVLARTTWDVAFDHDRTAVTLRSTFLLRREDRWRIAVYLNHDSLLENLGLDGSPLDSRPDGGGSAP